MAEAHAEAVHRHEAPTGFIWKYVFSLDHKVIGIQYYFLALFSVFVGLALSILMRLHLVWPNASVPLLDKLSANGRARAGVISPEYYLSLLTLHGTLMVFFVLTTAPQSGFGNYFSAHPNRRGRHGFPTPQHDVLLGDVCGLGGSDGHVLHPRRPAHWRLDRPTRRFPPSEAPPGRAWPWARRCGSSPSPFSAWLPCSAPSISSPPLWTFGRAGMSLMKLPLTCWAWFITAILACFLSRCCWPPACCCCSIAWGAPASLFPAA